MLGRMSSFTTASEDTRERLKNLLEELRIMLPGVEILFGFLLTVPFSSRAEQITSGQQYTYYVALMAAAASVGCLVAPSIQHRLEGEDVDLEQLLRSSTRLAIVGMVFLAVVITAVVFLVSDVLFGATTAAIGAASIAALVIVLWFVMPLVRRSRRQRRTGRS